MKSATNQYYDMGLELGHNTVRSKISAFIFFYLHYSESEQLEKKKTEWKILIVPYSPEL